MYAHVVCNWATSNVSGVNELDYYMYMYVYVCM